MRNFEECRATASLFPETYGERRGHEIDAINGAIVRLGEEEGIATPANWLLTRLVQARERLSGGR